MKQISTISTLMLFARTAVRRMLNRSMSMQLSGWLKKSAAPAAATARAATRHRADQISPLKRLAGLWLPALSLSGIVMMSFGTMFIMLESVLLNESSTAAVLRLSPEHYENLRKVAAIRDQQQRNVAIDEAFSQAYSGPTAWLASAQQQLARTRFDHDGLKAFAPLSRDGRWSGTFAYLSPEGRAQALRTVGAYLALLNVGIFGIAFGLMSKNLSSADPNLTWLWQFPISRRALFIAKLIESVLDNPAAPVMTIFYATVLWLSGASFTAGFGCGLLLGIAAAVATAAVRLAVEIFISQRLTRQLRGSIVAAAAAIGSTIMLAAMLGGNAQVVIESFNKLVAALPAWFAWNPWSAGLGSDAMIAQRAGWWLVAPAIAAGLATAAVLFAVRLTSAGLNAAQDSARRTALPAARVSSRLARLGAVAGKELLQLRRRPELLGQVFAAPLTIVILLYLAGHSNDSLIGLATRGGTTISVAILVSAAYMLIAAAGQTLTRELKSLWLLQCQPRPLADVVRGKARVWSAIAIGLSLPFIGAAIVMRPNETASILVRVPFLIAALWLLAELVFGLMALAASITSEDKVRFRRSALLLPALVVSSAAVAIYTESWWLQLSVLATLAILNVAMRERQLVELPWLSEPAEAPPKQFYAMHGILAVVGFQALMGCLRPLLTQQSPLSAAASTTVAYLVAAVAVSAACVLWLRWNRTTLPALRRGPAGRPIFWGLSVSCIAGVATTLVLCRLVTEGRLPVDVGIGTVQHASYDKWFLLLLYVVAAPLFEEWIFRGLIYRSLRRNWGIAVSIGLTALLFATIHPVGGCVALLTLGTMTARAAEKTGRLWPSITIHAGYNLMVWLLCVAAT